MEEKPVIRARRGGVLQEYEKMPATTSDLQFHKERLIGVLRAHPFLARCREGGATLEELKVFLVQHGLYSSYFTRYLCAMMASLPGNKEVLELAENLFEELGFSEHSDTPHYIIYRDMLDSLGLSLEGRSVGPQTRRLIDTMFDHCRSTDPCIGLGALYLGAEALVSSMYSDLIKGFESHGVDTQQIRFFHLHVQCDDAHAETIQRHLEAMVEADPLRLDKIVRAGEALVAARMAFFDGVEAEYAACPGTSVTA